MLKLNFIRKILSSIYLILCLISFLSLDMSFRVIYGHVFGEGLFQQSAILFTLSWSVMFTAIIALLPGVLKRIVMMTFILFFSTLTLVHAAMYNIFHNFFSFADIIYATEGARFFSFTYISIRKLMILSVLFSIVMMGLAAWAAPKRRTKGKMLVPVLSALLILASGISIFTLHSKLAIDGNKVQMSWASAKRRQPDSVLYSDFTNINHSMRISGLYQYTARNLSIASGFERWVETSSVHKRLDEIFQERKMQGIGLDKNEMSGKFAGKNLIMIMLESIDTWMITEDYMPHLYSVKKESISFDNHYSPSFISAATFNSEFMALTGLIPPTAGIKHSAYTTNNFSMSLPALFRRSGYRADSFHSAEPIIYNRGAIHKNIGFSSYNCHYHMGMDDYMLDSQLIRAYHKMVAQEPFFDFLITYSGHGPYTEELSNISEPHYERAFEAVKPSGIAASQENMDEYTRAIAHAMETDGFVGELMDRLKSDGLIDNTVLIFFSDHYSKYLTDTQFIMELKGVNATDLLSNTPFFIYSKDIEPKTIRKYTSTIDIYPTIVNLFGLDSDLSYFVGDDMFGEKGNYVMFRNYAWYDGQTYYSEDFKGEMTDEIAVRSAEVRDRINLSWDTMVSDYFSYMPKDVHQ